MIDWAEFAEKNGLTIDEFREEIFILCAALGNMMLDYSNSESGDAITLDLKEVVLTVTKK
jgi:hypothetical protein